MSWRGVACDAHVIETNRVLCWALTKLREAQAPPPGVWLSLRLGDGVEDGAMKIWLWFFGVVVEASLRAEVGKRLGSNRSAPKFVA